MTWKWTGFNEVHTVTFGPDDVLAGLAASLFAGSDASTRSAACRPRLPALRWCTPTRCTATGCSARASSPTPGTTRRTRGWSQFTTPGDFNYVCLIHEGMAGVVHVTA